MPKVIIGAIKERKDRYKEKVTENKKKKQNVIEAD